VTASRRLSLSERTSCRLSAIRASAASTVDAASARAIGLVWWMLPYSSTPSAPSVNAIGTSRVGQPRELALTSRGVWASAAKATRTIPAGQIASSQVPATKVSWATRYRYRQSATASSASPAPISSQARPGRHDVRAKIPVTSAISTRSASG
jgi:hypothetical protein